MAFLHPTYLLRIAGFGNTEGQYVYSTGDPGIEVVGVPKFGTISAVPKVLRQKFELFKALGSDTGITVSMVYGAITEQVLDRTLVGLASTGGLSVRVTRAYAEGATLIFTTGGVPSSLEGELIWIAGEAMRVTSVGGDDDEVLTVERGQLGTQARPLFMELAFVGPQILRAPANLIGAAIVLSVVEEGVESDIFFGRVKGWGHKAGDIQITIGSEMSAILEAPYELYGTDLEGSTYLNLNPTTRLVEMTKTQIPLGFIDTPGATAGGFSALTHIWVDVELEGRIGDTVFDDLEDTRDTGAELSLLCKAALVQAPTGAFTLYSRGSGGFPVIRAEYTDTGRLFGALRNLSDMRCKLKRVSFADAVPGPLTPAEMFEELLTGTWPATARPQVPAQALGSLIAANGLWGGDVYQTEVFRDVTEDPEQIVVFPRIEGDKFVDMVEELLSPGGRVLVPDRLGRIAVVNPLETEGVPVVIEAQVRSEMQELIVDDRALLREVTLSRTYVDTKLHRIVSDVAQTAHASGGNRNQDLGIWVSRFLEPQDEHLNVLWLETVGRLQLSVPIVPLQVASTVPVDIGSTLILSSTGLIDFDGSRGVSNVFGIVLEIGRSLTSAILDLRVLLTGFAQDEAVVWAPTGEITNVSGSILTLGGGYSAGEVLTEAARFTVDQQVYLLDQFGTRRDTNDPPAAVMNVAGDTITVNFNVTPAEGDFVVLAGYDEQTIRSVYGYLADESGTLGAESDPGHIYSFST